MFTHSDPVPDCSDNDKKRILVVEDYEDIRRMISMVFHKSEYEVVACQNGTQALHVFLDTFRCCNNVGILMDLALPDINGLRVMSAIREIEKGSGSSCIPIKLGIVSAQNKFVEGTEVFNSLGVSLQISKPFDEADLKSKVARWIEEPSPELYQPRERSLLTASGVSLYSPKQFARQED